MLVKKTKEKIITENGRLFVHLRDFLGILKKNAKFKTVNSTLADSSENESDCGQQKRLLEKCDTDSDSEFVAKRRKLQHPDAVKEMGEFTENGIVDNSVGNQEAREKQPSDKKVLDTASSGKGEPADTNSSEDLMNETKKDFSETGSGEVIEIFDSQHSDDEEQEKLDAEHNEDTADSHPNRQSPSLFDEDEHLGMKDSDTESEQREDFVAVPCFGSGSEYSNMTAASEVNDDVEDEGKQEDDGNDEHFENEIDDHNTENTSIKRHIGDKNMETDVVNVPEPVKDTLESEKVMEQKGVYNTDTVKAELQPSVKGTDWNDCVEILSDDEDDREKEGVSDDNTIQCADLQTGEMSRKTGLVQNRRGAIANDVSEISVTNLDDIEEQGLQNVPSSKDAAKDRKSSNKYSEKVKAITTDLMVTRDIDSSTSKIDNMSSDSDAEYREEHAKRKLQYSATSSDEDPVEAAKAKRFKERREKKFVRSVGKKKTSSDSREGRHVGLKDAQKKDQNSYKSQGQNKHSPSSSHTDGPLLPGTRKHKEKRNTSLVQKSPKKSPVLIMTDSESGSDVEDFKRKHRERENKRLKMKFNINDDPVIFVEKLPIKFEPRDSHCASDTGSNSKVGSKTESEGEKSYNSGCEVKDKKSEAQSQALSEVTTGQSKKRVSVITLEYYNKDKEKMCEEGEKSCVESSSVTDHRDKTVDVSHVKGTETAENEVKKANGDTNSIHSGDGRGEEREMESVPCCSKDDGGGVKRKKGSAKQIGKLENLLGVIMCSVS